MLKKRLEVQSIHSETQNRKYISHCKLSCYNFSLFLLENIYLKETKLWLTKNMKLGEFGQMPSRNHNSHLLHLTLPLSYAYLVIFVRGILSTSNTCVYGTNDGSFT